MRYSIFAGGKRLRPILAMSAGEVIGEAPETVLPVAVALECIHTYSLIHDDLPAMDNDDFRRGKPTSHKVFGEAVAILAGDALLTLAFEILSAPGTVRSFRPATLLAVTAELSAAAGSRNLIAGQVLDMMSEGRPVAPETVDRIVRKKTGALIAASVTCGALLAEAPPERVGFLRRYGESLGAAFQIRDDLLDLEGDPEKLGKAVQKDRNRGKATYPELLGKDQARNLMARLVDDALDAIRPFGERAEPLKSIAAYIGRRTH
jgi:geranylgeranyl diphosphate synthase, type II